MLKLKHKIQYAIDLGVDFLLRNTDDEGNIFNEQDLYRHFLATLCLVENPRNEQKKVDNALRKIARHTYSQKGMFFILDSNNEKSVLLTSIAVLCFLSANNVLWGERYLNFLIQNKKNMFENEYFEQSLNKIYKLSNDKKWLDKIKKTEEKTTSDLKTTEKLLYELLATQQDGTNLVLAGAFYDNERIVRIDYSQKNITTLKKTLDMLVDV